MGRLGKKKDTPNLFYGGDENDNMLLASGTASHTFAM